MRLLSRSRFEYLEAIIDANRATDQLWTAVGNPPADSPRVRCRRTWCQGSRSARAAEAAAVPGLPVKPSAFHDPEADNEPRPPGSGNVPAPWRSRLVKNASRA